MEVPLHLRGLAFPSGLAVEPGGNFFVADTWNNRIRLVDVVTGTITTIAQLTRRPGYLLLDDAGTLFVALPSGIGAVPGAIGAVSATVLCSHSCPREMRFKRSPRRGLWP